MVLPGPIGDPNPLRRGPWPFLRAPCRAPAQHTEHNHTWAFVLQGCSAQNRWLAACQAGNMRSMLPHQTDTHSTRRRGWKRKTWNNVEHRTCRRRQRQMQHPCNFYRRSSRAETPGRTRSPREGHSRDVSTCTTKEECETDKRPRSGNSGIMINMARQKKHTISVIGARRQSEYHPIPTAEIKILRRAESCTYDTNLCHTVLECITQSPASGIQSRGC